MWHINSRGNKYSCDHLFYDPDESPGPFWNFSFTELALGDLPAVIDYILIETNREALKYVGHSQGGTILLILLSMFPEYNAKIVIACLMAPLGYMEHLNPVLSTLFKGFPPLLVRVQFRINLPID